MNPRLYGLRKGHENRIFILLFNSLQPTRGNADSRLLKSRIKIGEYRDLCSKNRTGIYLHSVFNTYDYVFLCLYNQSRRFENSKMVNWVNLVQKLTKVQGKL